ncbi:hypothetical protein E4099_03115 [Streptomyces palmae]|uniref:Uncharacterized protein n=1 Tax=Streptomyces palmae TaxID=1701085 RepID=A0A4Z0HII7_9ACTN|nr:hypothetical protein E4099_03115 [Streptomyces palmae]
MDQACPVCGNPEQGTEFCAVCAWLLHDDPVLGDLTEEDVRRAASALRAAEHAWDVRAAALAVRGADVRDGGGGGPVADVLRGGPPRPGEKVPSPPEDSPGNMPEAGAAGCRDILDELLGRHVEELLFIEFTPEGVQVIKVSVGEGGIPRHTDGGSTEWRSLAPALDAREDIRRFQLAGGIGTLPPVGRTEFDATVRRWLRAYIPPSRERSLVLLTPRGGWVLLERAAAIVRGAYPLRAELRRGHAVAADGPTPDAVGEVLRTAPLLADHTLLLARADRLTGAVRPHSHVLFPAGSRLAPGETATAEVVVHGGVGPPAPLLLPVLAGAPAADGTGAVPLAVHQVTVGPLEQARLRFVLRGPGEVDLVAPAAGAPGTQGRRSAVDVPGLVRRLPRRVIRPPRLELLCTVELSGAQQAETEERLAFVRDLITALARQDGSGAAFRAGAVGHYDHAVHENLYTSRRTLLQAPVPAGPPHTTLAALAGWRPAQRTQDMASSLEDALKALVQLVTGAAGATGAEDVRRVVLIVARRPPGLPEQRGIVPACPLGVDWQPALDRLRAAGVQVMTRADPVTGPLPYDHPGAAARRYADAAWAALSADGAFRPGTDSAADVARALAPPWRLEGPDCRLAFAAPLI